MVYQEGDYDYYLEKLAARQRAAAETASPAGEEKKAVPSVKSRERRLTWKEAKELEGIEPAILDAEAKVAELETQFSTPDFFTKHGNRAGELATALEETRATVTRLYARWEELEAIRAAQQPSS